MSGVIDLCEDGDDDNGEWPNTASVPSLPLFRKRSRDKDESSNVAHSRNENGPETETATGSAKFVVDLEFADEVEVSPHRKRRGVLKSERNAKTDAAEITVAAAASQPMNSDSEQTSRDEDGSVHNKHSQKLSTSKPSTNASGRRRESLSAVAVAGGTHQVIVTEGDLTANTILGREAPINIDDSDDSFEDALPYQAGDWAKNFKELCEYRQSKGQCIFRCQDPEYAELSNWVFSQRREYRKNMVGGKSSILTPARVKALEGIGFVCNPSDSSWEDRLSELAGFRKIHGSCNVPKNYSENTKLANWISTQRYHYRLKLEGKTSSMTLPRIEALQSLGFEWEVFATAREDRLSELADCRKIHGNCNVPKNYSENTKLACWVSHQRQQYKMRAEGKKSPLTSFRIQEMEILGFDWKPPRKGAPKKPSLVNDATCSREGRGVTRAYATAQPQEDYSSREIRSNQVDAAFEPEESDWNGEVDLGIIPGRTYKEYARGSRRCTI
jgi:hypothetical protein